MITEEKVNPWVNLLQCPNYIRPRLYTPYYEEAKSALRSRAGGSGANSNSTECLGYPSSSSSNQPQTTLAYLNSLGRMKTLRPIIPDTLYMIDDGNGVVSYHTGGNGGAGGHHHHHHHHRQIDECSKSNNGKEHGEDARNSEEKAGNTETGGNGDGDEGGRSGVVDELGKLNKEISQWFQLRWKYKIN